MSQPPLIAHILYRLDFGGIETLLVECVNRIPVDKYRQVIICLTESSDFAAKITNPNASVYALHKQEGNDFRVHWRLWRLLRKLRPAIVHTYNLPALECALTAFLAGAPVRVHAEHGRSATDPRGVNRKHNLLRRLLAPVIDRFIPVSRDLQQWLTKTVGVSPRKIELIVNGVDDTVFKPVSPKPPLPVDGFASADSFVIGNVGRVEPVKDQAALLEALAALRNLRANAAKARLVIIGNGPLLPALRLRAEALGVADQVWFPGARADVANIMRSFDVFVLSSRAEGMPVTLLEAMATALPIVATEVGGIPEVIQDGVNGFLVPPGEPQRIAQALAAYLDDAVLARRHGEQGRLRVEREFSLVRMVAAYVDIYDRLCREKCIKAA